MIRIGIIGAGPNATEHGRYYARSGRAKVVAVADPDAGRARALAGEISARPLADYRDFLEQVDAVVISSPSFLHRGHAVECAAAGKHIYCEKPQGLSAGEAREIVAAVRGAGVKSMVGFSPRLHPTARTLLRYQGEGRFGELISIFTRRLCHIPPASLAGWRRDPGQSGGLLLEINIHELDWMMMLGGEVASVYAQMRPRLAGHPRANDQLWFLLNFAKGVVGAHEGSWFTALPQFFRGLYGTAGGACTDEWGTKLMYAATGQNRQDVLCDSAFDLRANFLDTIENKAAAECDAAWGLKVMTVAEAIFQSAATNQVVTLTAV